MDEMGQLVANLKLFALDRLTAASGVGKTTILDIRDERTTSPGIATVRRLQAAVADLKLEAEAIEAGNGAAGKRRSDAPAGPGRASKSAAKVAGK